MSNDRIIRDKHIENEVKISLEISGCPNAATLHISGVLNSVLKGVWKEEVISYPEVLS